MDNLIATIILNREPGDPPIKHDPIADAQGFDRAEFSARFAHIQTAAEQALWNHTRKPSEYGEDGK
jgi:hypothetical protein